MIMSFSVFQFFNGYPNIFDLDLKNFFKNNASQEGKYIDYNFLSKEFLTPSGNNIIFLKNYVDLYNFWYDILLHNKSLNEIKLQQLNFLEDLMNSGRFGVYANILKLKTNKQNIKLKICAIYCWEIRTKLSMTYYI